MANIGSAHILNLTFCISLERFILEENWRVTYGKLGLCSVGGSNSSGEEGNGGEFHDDGDG